MKSFCLINIILIFTSWTNDFVYAQAYTKSNENDSTILFTFTDKGVVLKKLRFNSDGIRNGISEEWHYDDKDLDHIIYLYKNGILNEISTVFFNGDIISKSVFEDGVEKINIQLSAALTTDKKLVYIKKVYNTNLCGFIQYKIINGMVVDSLSVPYGR